MTNDNWRWANKPYPDRLWVQETGENVIRFIDDETDEAITVYAPDDLERVTMAVNGLDRRSSHIGRGAAAHFVKGEGIARRDVWHYITRDEATALRAGLTVHHSAFSSTPHAFERSPEPGFEELFYFMTDGKGLLEGEGLWPTGEAVDAAWPVRDRQFAQVPMGMHRVTALSNEDGVLPRMAYIWAYLCLKPGWEKD